MGDVHACSMLAHILHATIMRTNRNIFRKIADPGLHYFGKPDPGQSEKLDPHQSQNSGAVEA